MGRVKESSQGKENPARNKSKKLLGRGKERATYREIEGVQEGGKRRNFEEPVGL